MLNKKMIEKFKQIEKIINDCDFFTFYTFDEFIKRYNDKNDYDFNDIDDVDEYNENLYYIDLLQHEYHCNNDNTIILLYRCDDDEYLLLNFETNDKIIMQNVIIENVNDDITNNALYYILCDLFTNEYCCYDK